MAVKLFNTMTRSVELLEPQHDRQVTLYTCGPTVYDYAQIGNWATYIRWDILVRTLLASNYIVKWVMNITDVGHLVSDADEGIDKLEKGARREHKTAWEVASFYTQDFLHGMQQLNISNPTHMPRATELITEQIDFVQQLEKKGYIYRTDDGMYFDTGKITGYGRLARLDITGLQGGARVELNKQKRHITDFAVWKFSPAHEHRDMEWESPWGKGFPGWHLECSVMAMKYLGETLDIHAGGFDHLPVHHPNEIAQTEALTGKPLAHIWLHSNFVTVNHRKLSKSLGNSFTLHDVVTRGFEPLALRLLFLQSHYRTEADFSWESLTAASHRLQGLRAMAELQWQSVAKAPQVDFAAYHLALLTDLQDDLNSPRALAKLSELEQLLQVGGLAREQHPEFIQFLGFVDQLLGLGLSTVENLTNEQKNLLAEREAARQAKDFKQADELRATLEQQNVGIRDTKNGAIWFRIARR